VSQTNPTAIQQCVTSYLSDDYLYSLCCFGDMAFCDNIQVTLNHLLRSFVIGDWCIGCPVYGSH